MKLQPLYRMQGHQPSHLILDQAAQGPIQPGLEHLQGQGNAEEQRPNTISCVALAEPICLLSSLHILI